MRLFVALDFPDQVRENLRNLIARLKAESRNARWVRPEGMHMTVKFVGETDSENLAAIREALAAVSVAGPVEMHFRGLGFFPNERRPRVVWCGVEATPNLPGLAGALNRALKPLGFPAEAREFVPHLTLGRIQAPSGNEKLVRAAEELKAYDFGSATETQFHLYQSVLERTGAVYTRLESFSLGKGSS